MIVSKKSLKNFFIVNGFLLFLGIIQYQFILYFTENKITDFLYIFFIFIIRNYSLLQFIDNVTKNKPNISNSLSTIPKEDYKYEFHYNVITTTSVETITHIIITKTMTFSNNGFLNEIIYFIPLSFLFEVVFDLFHYTSHYILHNNKYLYKYHKKHHKFNHPKAIITFYQHPLDLLMTNSIPTIAGLIFVPVSYFQFHLILVYKNFIEIGGHIGKKSYPTPSFAQFIWLPKFLYIDLYTEDHDLHHSLNNCNYAKRFSLWDKFFGTYKSSYIPIQ